MAGRMPEYMSDEMSENMSDRMPDRLPDRMPGGMSGYMPDRMPEYMPEYMSDRMSEYTKYMSKYTSWHVMVGITRSRVILLGDNYREYYKYWGLKPQLIGILCRFAQQTMGIMHDNVAKPMPFTCPEIQLDVKIPGRFATRNRRPWR